VVMASPTLGPYPVSRPRPEPFSVIRFSSVLFCSLLTFVRLVPRRSRKSPSRRSKPMRDSAAASRHGMCICACYAGPNISRSRAQSTHRPRRPHSATADGAARPRASLQWGLFLIEHRSSHFLFSGQRSRANAERADLCTPAERFRPLRCWCSSAPGRAGSADVKPSDRLTPSPWVGERSDGRGAGSVRGTSRAAYRLRSTHYEEAEDAEPGAGWVYRLPAWQILLPFLRPQRRACPAMLAAHNSHDVGMN
jgi:hypothetical protein